MTRRWLISLIAVPATALAISSCGSSGGDSASPTPESSSAAAEGAWATSDCSALTPPTVESTPPADSATEGQVAVTLAAGKAPVVGVEESATSTDTLVNVDLAAGAGDPVAAGATVTVEYCGIGMNSKAIFDSSWARGAPATFPLDGVITGWQEGIPGMQPGGRRLLIIPAALAYGDTPPPGSGIEAGESLLFVVDLISSP